MFPDEKESLLVLIEKGADINALDDDKISQRYLNTLIPPLLLRSCMP